MRRISTLAFLGLLVSFAQIPRPAQGQGPTLILQKGRADSSYTIALSKDGNWLVTAGHDGAPTLWETATGRQVRTFHGHRDFINDMAFSEDGKWLATCSGQGLLEIDEAKDTVRFADATTRLWNVATGKQVQAFPHEGKVTCLSFSADGILLATAGSNHVACVWNTRTGKRLHAFRHPAFEDGGVNSLTLSADGARLYTADDRIRAWDLATGKQVREFPPHGETKVLKATENVPSTIAGKNVVREVIREIKQPTWIGHIALTADGKELVTLGGDGRIVVWNAENGNVIRQFQSKGIRSSAFEMSPDGRWLFAECHEDKCIQMWDLITGKMKRTFPVNHTYSHGVSVSQDGKWLFATDNSADGANVSARMWEVATGQLVRVFAGMFESVNAVSLSDDGKRLATASGNKYSVGPRTAQLWDLSAGKQVRVFKGHASAVNSVAISPDGKRLASGGSDYFTRIWDADTGKELHSFRGKSATVTVSAVSFSRDGNWLATATGGSGSYTSDPETRYGVRSINVQTGVKTRAFYQGDGVRAVAISPDGNALAAGGWSKRLVLWDTNTGKALREFDGHTDVVSAVGLSRDGKWLVSASFDGTARLWDARTGDPIRAIDGHKGEIYCLALTRDGKCLATGGSDGTVRLNELATGKTIRVFKGHTAGVTGVALSADGKRLISGSIDGTTRIWNANTGKELCRLLTLTDGGWIALADDGRFDSDTEKDVVGAHWVNGMETSPMRDRVPGLVGKLLED